jgi:diguanylate cyclase (GGDEF)-like protein
MRQAWRQKLAIIQEWSVVERGCIPAALVALCFVQYSAWGLFALYYDKQGVLIDRAAMLAVLVPELLIIPAGVLIVLLGLALRRRSPDAEWYQHLTANFYGLSLVWGGYLIGPLSFTTGIVLTGAPIIGFILLSRRVMVLAIAVAFFSMLAINLGTAYGLLPYAPLLLSPHDTESALLWTHSHIFFAAPHIIVNTTLCAVLLGQWRKREADVLALSLTDVLTGVHNRRSILSLLEAELARAQRQGTPLAVALLDLDHFKRINDGFGHPMGDRVLQEAARALKQCMRQCDAIGRFGGEEFLLLLPGTDREGAALLAERCRATLAALAITADNGERVPVSGSFGLAGCAAGPGTSVEDLVRAADTALYEAKAGGRNRVTLAPSLAAAGSTAPPSAAAAVRWEGRLRQLAAVTEAGFMAEVGGRPWWQSRAGWRRFVASVREWSPVAKCGAIMVLVGVMQLGFLLWQLYLLQRPDRDTLFDIATGRFLAGLMATELLLSGLLLVIALWLRRRAPDARWFQHLSLQFFSLAMIAGGAVLGIFYLPTGVMLTASPMLGYLLFRRGVVTAVFLAAITAVVALAYAGALGLLPYAPLLSLAGPAYQLHAPWWVYSNFLFYLPTVAVVWVLAYQIFGRWREREAEIRALSLTDALTQVHNRRSIIERLQAEVQRSARSGAPLTVALLDLDHFKRINDTWGHPTGDRVLKEAARALKTTVRETDAVGRFGGEEFLLVLPDTGLEAAQALLERCRRNLAQAVITADSGENFFISASFGVSCSTPQAGVHAEDLTRSADAALYRAKAAGRNRVEVATPG